MINPGLALDTASLLSYASGHREVGWQIAKAADKNTDVLVPALCLTQAHCRASHEQWVLLEVLAMLPHVRVTPVEVGMCAILGGFTRRMADRMDLAQLAMEVAAHPLVPIMTDRRGLLGEVLPKEWPIIDL